MTGPDEIVALAPKIIFGAAAAALGGMIAYGLRVQRRRAEALRGLAGFLDGNYASRLFVPSFSGNFEGLPFLIELLPGSKNSPPLLQIAVTASPRFTLGIGRESLGASISKAVGLVKDLETPDPQFNADFVLDGAPAAEAGAFLNDAGNREYIRRFFDSGFTSVEFLRDKVQARKPRFELEADLYPQVAAERVQVLARLAKASL